MFGGLGLQVLGSGPLTVGSNDPFRLNFQDLENCHAVGESEIVQLGF